MVAPQSHEQWKLLSAFLLQHAGVQPSADQRFVAWVSDGKVVIVVGFNGFIGKLAQIHFAFAPGWHFSPRRMLREVFRYAFVEWNLEMLVGVVSSKNEKAMRMDAHLGFKELYRLPGMHDEGGDMVLLGMRKEECRYLDPPADLEPQPLEMETA